MRKILPATLLLSVLLAACGGSPVPAVGPVTGGTPPVTNQPLDQQEMNMVTATSTPQVHSAVTQFASGTGFGTMPVFGAAGEGKPGLSAQADPCTTTAGNTTDGDSDGIYKDYKATFDCTYPYSGLTLTYKGDWNLLDKNDADKKSGFKYTLNMLGTVSGSMNGATVNVKYDIKNGLDVDPKADGGMKAVYTVSSAVTGSTTHSGHTVNTNASSALNLSMESTPDADKLGTTVTLDGNVSVKDAQKQIDGYATFEGSLHYSHGKNGCTGIDRGSFTYTSGGVTKKVTYTGCNTYQ